MAERYFMLAERTAKGLHSSSSTTSARAAVSLQEIVQSLSLSLDAKKTGYAIAAAVQLGALVYIGTKLYRAAVVRLDTHKELRRCSSRLFKLATQGTEAAGGIPADLGQPDQHGVYTHHSSTGDIYFRQSQRSYGTTTWEFSTDKAFWIPACHADSFWYSPDSSPSTADKVFIQRLEVETQLVSRHTSGGGACSSAAHVPELDLSHTVRDLSKLSQVPAAFLCPISMQIMTQPVVTPSGGSFNRPALMEWIRQHQSDPVSGNPLRSDQVFPNLAMRDMIHEWAHGCSSSSDSQQQQLYNMDGSSSSYSHADSGSSSGRKASLLHTV